ncbi:MATE family efflux transporter [Thaumasiovibrio subtropicus]|uniref:MATE family efflux transporter n=1 Tax=Thaumasiovibrio subtropicus TaxID=1891207 RepID=UPI000B34EA26|nr:MATE family efflux transporter [Thaumasiovibrio subtropicus]
MQNYIIESKKILKLSAPLFIAQVAQTSMGFVDTVMAGGVSATDMAAVAVATSIWLPTLLFGLGVLMALTPIIAQLNGAGKQQKIPFQVQQGVFLSLLLCIPLMLLLGNAVVIVDLMDIETVLRDKTLGYLDTVVWALPGVYLFTVLRGYCEGRSFTAPAMYIGFLGLLANIPLNWIFVYGEFGAPQLGAVGCAVATVIVYWLMTVALFFFIHFNPQLSKLKPFSCWQKPQYNTIKRQFLLGLPVALSLFFEVTLFACIAIFLAPLGAIVVAAHQVAMNFSSLIFMIPLSIGMAVSIRVGHQVGEERLQGAKVASFAAIAIGVAISIVTAFFSITFRESIALIYSDNAEVVLLAGQLMIMAAIYQFSDAIQVIAAGALRGYKDMNAIFLRTLFAYWGVGLPLGYILGRTDLLVERMGVYGFWVGTIIGLTVAAILLGQRLLWLQHRDKAFFATLAQK